jgi:hypothetical protein
MSAVVFKQNLHFHVCIILHIHASANIPLIQISIPVTLCQVSMQANLGQNKLFSKLFNDLKEALQFLKASSSSLFYKLSKYKIWKANSVLRLPVLFHHLCISLKR